MGVRDEGSTVHQMGITICTLQHGTSWMFLVDNLLVSYPFWYCNVKIYCTFNLRGFFVTRIDHLGFILFILVLIQIDIFHIYIPPLSFPLFLFMLLRVCLALLRLKLVATGCSWRLKVITFISGLLFFESLKYFEKVFHLGLFLLK